MIANAPALAATTARLLVASVLVLPLNALAWSSAVSVEHKVVVAALLGAAVATPVVATIALIVLLPVVAWLATRFGGLSPTQLAEALVMAYGAGTLVRISVRQPEIGFAWLERPACVFGAAIVASVIDDLFAVRAIRPAEPFLPGLWAHLVGDYWGETFADWPSLHVGIRWIAVLVLAVQIERVVRQPPPVGRFVIRVWLFAGALGTLFTVRRLIEVVDRLDLSVFGSLRWLLGDYRMSALHPDPNAAGSLFGLLLAAAIVCWLRTRRHLFALATVPLLTIGFVMAKSRAAVGAGLLVWAFVAVWRSWRGRRFALVLVAVVALTGAAAVWMATSRAHISASQAIRLRLQMAAVGVQLVGRDPVFGLGIGDYPRVSRRFVPEEFRELAAFAPAGENAHNNLLQIAAELGVPALAAFLAFVGSAFVSAWRHGVRESPPEYEAVIVGLAVFLVSALFGHPLLIFEVAALFAVALGLACAVQQDVPVTTRVTQAITCGAVVFYAISIVWRV